LLKSFYFADLDIANALVYIIQEIAFGFIVYSAELLILHSVSIKVLPTICRAFYTYVVGGSQCWSQKLLQWKQYG